MGIFELTFRVAWENSRHLATLQLVSPPNDVWETSAEIPYWWRVTIKIWVMLLIGRATWEIWFNQSQAPPRSWEWRVVSLESLRSFIKRHLEGKPMEASPNVSCFLWPLSMFFFFAFFSGFLHWIVLILAWFETSLHPPQVSRQSRPWPLKLMMSQAVEGIWICSGGSGANGLMKQVGSPSTSLKEL